MRQSAKFESGLSAQAGATEMSESVERVRMTAGRATQGLGHQFGGSALWSTVFGLASVMVPLVTPVYFPILPIVGLWRGVLAVRSGRVADGVIGLVINAIGCIVSLLASGLLFHSADPPGLPGSHGRQHEAGGPIRVVIEGAVGDRQPRPGGQGLSCAEVAGEAGV